MDGPDFGSGGDDSDLVEVEPQQKQEILENKDVSIGPWSPGGDKQSLCPVLYGPCYRLCPWGPKTGAIVTIVLPFLCLNVMADRCLAGGGSARSL